MDLDEFFALIDSLELCVDNNAQLKGTCTLKTQNTLDKLKSYITDPVGFDLTVLDDLTLNKELSFIFKPHPRNEGIGFASYQHYFENKPAWWGSNLDKDIDRIVEHRWFKYKNSAEAITLKNLQSTADLINLLKNPDYFYSKENTVVIFHKEPSEISLKSQNSKEFANLVRETSDEQIQAIQTLSQWFNTDIKSTHSYAKKNAFSMAIVDFLTKKEGIIKHDICDVLKDIVKIQKQAFVQYDLYLEDFNYSKFIKKIEENSNSFITRINDSLSKSTTQIIGLPIATLAFNFLKIEHTFVSAIALFFYSLLCLLVLINQVQVLRHIINEFKSFEEKLPDALKKGQWVKSKKAINAQARSQYLLAIFLGIIIVICLKYAGYLLVPYAEAILTNQSIEASVNHHRPIPNQDPMSALHHPTCA